MGYQFLLFQCACASSGRERDIAVYRKMSRDERRRGSVIVFPGNIIQASKEGNINDYGSLISSDLPEQARINLGYTIRRNAGGSGPPIVRPQSERPLGSGVQRLL
jgi:hypothetical protein